MAAHCPIAKHTLRALVHAGRTEEEHSLLPSLFSPKNSALWVLFLRTGWSVLFCFVLFPPCVALICTNKQKSKLGFCCFFRLLTVLISCIDMKCH